MEVRTRRQGAQLFSGGPGGLPSRCKVMCQLSLQSLLPLCFPRHFWKKTISCEVKAKQSYQLPRGRMMAFVERCVFGHNF